MSYPVNLCALPSGVFEEVFTPENVRGRSFTAPPALMFPKSRCALWDSSPTGQKLRLHLCTHRNPRLKLLEKALRLAQRHTRHSNKPCVQCFFVGSLSVDADEEGVTLTLDRFDPGRDQGGSTGRVPSTVLPGDVLVPCLFSTDASSDPVIQSEADFHQTFKALQQSVSGRQPLDLCQLLKVKGHVVSSQRSDAASFSLSWSGVCPSVTVDVQPIRAIPIIPTALLRSFTNAARLPLPHGGNRQRGFVTMDQTRKLLLLLESDPKACTLPLVGLWISGVTHVHSPQVWSWCLRFLFSSILQDRVLSESGWFLLVLLASTHRAPQFFQCRSSGPAHVDFQLLTASQSTTLYQVASVDGQSVECDLGSDGDSRQMEVFRGAQSSFNSAPPIAAGLSVSDQDSGVEDEDLSPRPSPSPHPPAQQALRVQPSVPELSLLIDSSFSSTQNPGPTHKPPPADRKCAPPPSNTPTSSSAPKQAPPVHLHSTPNSNLLQPCSCCTTYNCTTICSSPGPHHPAPPPCNLHPPPSNLHSTPPTLHSTPFNLHPAPPNLHPAPPNLHPAPPNLHPAPSNLHPAPSNLPSTPLNLHPTPSNLHPPPLSLLTPLPNVHPASSRPSTLPGPPPYPCSHPPLVPWSIDSTPPHPSQPAVDTASPPWLPHPSCLRPCCEQQVAGITSNTYQLLLHQDRQLRLLQTQVQMLLEAQGKLQSSRQRVDADTSTRGTASIAVGTGASLFWAQPSPLPHRDAQAPPSTSLTPPPSPTASPSPSASSTSPHSASRHSLQDCAVVEAQDEDISIQDTPQFPPHQPSLSGLQSPVLGESVSMYGPTDDQQSFYQNLMTQLTSRLQEPENRQEVKDEESPSRRRSLCVLLDHTQPCAAPSPDRVVSATLRRLQQLGVDVDKDELSESDRSRHQTAESTSTLACINPAAALSRLSVSEPGISALFPGGSVDLSLEANAIALRYLNDAQLSRLSLGGHTPKPEPTSSSSTGSLLSPSNMSLATRKYMKRYGLIEEEEGEEPQEEVVARHPLTETQNTKLLPQSQLLRDLKPKMQLLARDTKRSSVNKENRRQPEGSVGNILDLSRLRQLPKLF